MPTIVFASSKGGVGKSTSAVLLATELSATGNTVTVIDADPNKPLSDWATHKGHPETLRVESDVSEMTIIDVIELEERKSAYVIVDLEGSASMMVAYAISRADIVILPVQGSHLDAKEAVKSVQLVKQQERAFNKKIPFAVLFTRTSAAIRGGTLKNIVQQIKELGYPTFNVEIIQRDAYAALWSFGGTLYTLPSKKVSGIESAIANARAFAVEVLALLLDLASTGLTSISSGPHSQEEVA